MPKIDTSASLGTLVAERPARAQLFERLRLDYCCGGAQSLDAACSQRGLDPDTVAELLATLDDQPLDRAEPLDGRDWRRATVSELCERVVTVHHRGLRRDLPRIAELTATVARVHGKGHPELHDLERLFAGLRDDLERHMEMEEQVLFPAGRALADGQAPAEPIDELLVRHEDEHTDAGDTLVAMRELTAGYDDAGALCSTHRRLLDALRQLEVDLHQHIHEENNILFPRIRALIDTAGATGGSDEQR